MNIIYTVFGEGYGHAFRSYPTIRHLKEEGHNVRIIASEKSYQFLSKKFPDTIEITSYNMVYKDNAVKKLDTILLNLKKITKIPHNLVAMKKVTNGFKADVVITDFEPMGFLLAELHRIPLISIDNMHIITDTEIEIEPEDSADALISKAVIKAFVPARDYSLINTFFYPEIKESKKETTYLMPPTVREEIMATKPKPGKHILVYQTSKSYDELLNVLKNTDEKFIVYNTLESVKSKNIVYREFNDKQIFKDLAEAKGIIANGGFTLISEALFLQKPVLSIPVKNQYEQILNARMIKKLGLGTMAEEITSEVLSDWINNLENYKIGLKKIKFNNNILLEKIDEILTKIEKSRNLTH